MSGYFARVYADSFNLSVSVGGLSFDHGHAFIEIVGPNGSVFGDTNCGRDVSIFGDDYLDARYPSGDVCAWAAENDRATRARTAA